MNDTTPSADENLTEAARRRSAAAKAAPVVRKLQGKVRVGRKLTREEMHER